MIEHIIYLPGLGDHHSRIQHMAANLWSIYGVEPHFHQIGWADGEPFEPKLERILDKIDTLAASGRISLVGISAGASAAINAFAERADSISKVITICGKIQNLDTVQEWRYNKNPAFRGSANMLPDSIKRLSPAELERMLNIYPLWDGVVSARDAIMGGAHHKRIFTTGHAFSIGCTVLFGAHSIAKFVKNP